MGGLRAHIVAHLLENEVAALDTLKDVIWTLFYYELFDLADGGIMRGNDEERPVVAFDETPELVIIGHIGYKGRLRGARDCHWDGSAGAITMRLRMQPGRVAKWRTGRTGQWEKRAREAATGYRGTRGRGEAIFENQCSYSTNHRGAF